VQSGSEDSVLILSSVATGGSYTFSWDKRGIAEASPLPPVRYSLRLTIGTKEYSSKVGWR